jgi:hypothetical protein
MQFAVDYYQTFSMIQPILVAKRTNACVCDHSLAEIAVSKPAAGKDVCLL